MKLRNIKFSVQRLIFCLIAVVVCLKMAIKFFNAPTTGLQLNHASGSAAIVEQASLAFLMPAAMTAQYMLHSAPKLLLGVSWYEQHSQEIRMFQPLTRVIACMLALWPLGVLCFHPWSSISSYLRWTALLYSTTYLLGVWYWFLKLHSIWDKMFWG